MAEGGFAAAGGAFLACAVLIVAAGLWRPVARAVSAIPISLSSAMLAGVLLDLCLAPVHAVRDMPELALPIVLTWALAWRFARLYAVPLAVAFTAVIVGLSTEVPASVLAAAWPAPVLVAPEIGRAHV